VQMRVNNHGQVYRLQQPDSNVTVPAAQPSYGHDYSFSMNWRTVNGRLGSFMMSAKDSGPWSTVKLT
jgi:hypothetical protein